MDASENLIFDMDTHKLVPLFDTNAADWCHRHYHQTDFIPYPFSSVVAQTSEISLHDVNNMGWPSQQPNCALYTIPDRHDRRAVATHSTSHQIDFVPYPFSNRDDRQQTVPTTQSSNILQNSLHDVNNMIWPSHQSNFGSYPISDHHDRHRAVATHSTSHQMDFVPYPFSNRDDRQQTVPMTQSSNILQSPPHNINNMGWPSHQRDITAHRIYDRDDRHRVVATSHQIDFVPYPFSNRDDRQQTVPTTQSSNILQNPLHNINNMGWPSHQSNFGSFPISDQHDRHRAVATHSTSHQMDFVPYPFSNRVDRQQTVPTTQSSNILQIPLHNNNNNHQLVLSPHRVSDRDDRQQPVVTTQTSDILQNIDPKLRSCDDSRMTVQTSDQPIQEKRLCCIFCKKTYPKLARHIEHVHKNETVVQKLIGLPKGSKERRRILDALRKKGGFEFNTNRKINNKQQLITSRRPNKKFVGKAKFRICADCLGSYSKNSVRQHMKKCTGNVLMEERSNLLLSRTVEDRIHESACERLRKFIPSLRNKAIFEIIRYDWLIIAFGNQMCRKYRKNSSNKDIRAKLRMCGRLLCELTTINKGITDFASLYRPKMYDSVLQAVRKIGQFDEETCEFKTPATALDALLQVKDVGKVLVSEFIKNENFEWQTKTENFLKLLNNDAGASIYKAVYSSQTELKRSKTDHVPTTSDIKVMSDYLDMEIEDCSKVLEHQFSYRDWLKLSELTLAWVIVFNRKRKGDAENILLTDFEARESIDEETISTLSPEDRAVATRFCRIKLCGKKERTVPALIKPEIEKAVKLLVDNRQAAKISDKNPYLFALPSTTRTKDRFIEACSVIRKFSEICGAKDPTTLRGTLLRKHLATMCVSKNLNDTDVSYVADFMGHHENVHRQYYRRNPMVDEVVKVSKLLEEAKGDGLPTVAGVGRKRNIHDNTGPKKSAKK